MTIDSADPRPAVVVHPPDGAPGAVALVLPGGRAESYELSQPRHLSAVRMRPIARALHAAGRRHGLAVWLLRYRYRGWNGEDMSPVADARWALEEVRREHGDLPVVLVGHSMGGRTALRVAGDTAVRGVAALAPWVLDSDPVEQLAGRRVLIAHGTRDRVTSPRASARYAERATAIADDVRYVEVAGERHAMVLRWPTWHRLAVTFVLDVVSAPA